jgi:hypothetical protein
LRRCIAAGALPDVGAPSKAPLVASDGAVKVLAMGLVFGANPMEETDEA